MSFQQLLPDLFRWTDTANVYVWKADDEALLIDLGDGSVLDALESIGVRRIAWALFTHHHREQCQGAERLKAWRADGARVAASQTERGFFEQPMSFRKWRPSLGDAFSVHGASYVRPPIAPIPIDRGFAKMDDFTWRGREFWCVETAGNSPGHMTYLTKHDAGWLAFSGDLMLAGARMHTWFDTEWDYGFAAGLYELAKSAAQIAGYEPAWLFPAHGPAIQNPRDELNAYVGKLRRLGPLYVRGYDIKTFDGCDQDNASRPSAAPHLWQVTPHLYKFRGPNYWVNFALLLAESGHGLIVDCGLFDRKFLAQAIERMRERLGLKRIDAIFVTHMHGDHALDAGFVRERYGAELWTMAGVSDKFERPWDYDFAALLPSYGPAEGRPGPLAFDRVFQPGESFDWEGYRFAVDWMPGQTPYHACLHGVVDGRRVAFTGDNIFASTTDPRQGGNECVVARNGGSLEEGYLYAAEFLHTINPDLIVGGHCWLLDQPAQLIARYRSRMLELREAFRDLSGDDDYRYLFDPYWAQVKPYRISLAPGEQAAAQLVVRNYLQRPQTFWVDFHAAAGLNVAPPTITVTTPAEQSLSTSVEVAAARDALAGLRLVALDVARDGARQGELFDFLTQVD